MEFTWQKEDKQEQTLKRFLVSKGVSHRLLGKIRRGQGTILLNNEKEELQHILAKGDKITLELPVEKEVVAIQPSEKNIDVLYEDQNWLVVSKPAGLTSVPGPSNRTDTLVNRVKYYLIKQQAENSIPHIITRLDRYTSGIVLLAKHGFAQGLIDKQVVNHSFDKRYYALVSGYVAKEHGFIEEPLRRKEGEAYQEVSTEGKSAKTEYWVKQHFGKSMTLVDVKLHTGRTHQIRVHFQYIGHPLVGDMLYRGPLNMGIKRQALHAYELSFADPFSQKTLTFKDKLPMDMRIVLENAKREL